MSNEKQKTVQLLSPTAPDGTTLAAISDGEGTQITPVKMGKTNDGEPIQPGQTMMMLESDDAPGRFKVTGEYTHPGPAHVTTDEYRTGWDAIFGERKVRPEDLN